MSARASPDDTMPPAKRTKTSTLAELSQKSFLDDIKKSITSHARLSTFACGGSVSVFVVFLIQWCNWDRFVADVLDTQVPIKSDAEDGSLETSKPINIHFIDNDKSNMITLPASDKDLSTLQQCCEREVPRS